MGLDAPALFGKLDETVTIDPAAHRRLGMHAVEYAQRHDLDTPATAELIAMLGL